MGTTIDWNVISSIATAGSAMMAGMAWWALKVQLRQGRENISVAILREHETQFFYTNEFMRIRADTCKFLLEQIFPSTSTESNTESADEFWVDKIVSAKKAEAVELPQEGWAIVDFLDSIAIYGDKGTIDIDMAFSKFFYFYNRYWFLLEPWIVDLRRVDGNVDYYQDISIFWRELVEYGTSQRGLAIKTPRYSPNEIREFLETELWECRA